MNILYISFLCVAPFIVYLCLGLISKKTLHIKEASFIDLNTIAFYFFLPMSLFFNIYNADFKNIDYSKSFIFSVASVILIFFISILIYGLRDLSDGDKAVMIQASFRSNFILFGIPLVSNIVQGQVSGLGGLLLTIVIPIFNVLATIIFSYYSGKRSSFLSVLVKILKNPLIIASVAALLLQSFSIRLPDFLIDILKPLSVMATPVALFALGGRFNFAVNAANRKLLIESIIVRLLLVPAIFTGIAVAIGIRGEALALLLALFGGPVAVTSYTMAQQMNGNEELAGQILVYSTILSNFSLFLFISLYKNLGFF